MTSTSPLDLDALRKRLEGKHGPQYWRSLEELSDEPAFQAFAQERHPDAQDALADPVRRRELLKIMGASFAFGGLAACTRQPVERILPYAKNPEHAPPGDPRYFATSMIGPGGAIGLLAESHQGRPIKVEGNPDHPASLGATDAFCQASVLEMYDPDRAQVVQRGGQISTWGAFHEALAAQLGRHADRGAGLRILTRTIQSPTLARMREELLLEYPEARWVQYEPCNRDSERRGAVRAFGRDVSPQLDLKAARTILTIDADLLAQGPGSIAYARQFATARAVDAEAPDPPRLYSLDSTWSVTGAAADHRLGLKPSQVLAATAAIARAVGLEVPGVAHELPERARRFVEAVSSELQDHRGRSVVVAGPSAAPEIHAWVHAINAKLENAGKTVHYTAPFVEVPEYALEGLTRLTRDLHAGAVHTLLILGGNPVYDAPAGVKFSEAMERATLRAHLSLFDDETSQRCHWLLPEAHYLESWGDTRAFDGTASITQPLVAPLYAGRSAPELIGRLLGAPEGDGYALVRETWAEWLRGGDFDAFWDQSVHDGVIAKTAFRTLDVSARIDRIDAAPNAPDGMEIVVGPDPTVWDGRYANNGWLQELPKPITLLTWGNALLVGPRTASAQSLVSGDEVEITCGGVAQTAPVWVLPGQPEGALGLSIGYGRERAGRVGSGLGVDAFALLGAGGLTERPIASLRKTGARHTLANVQEHSSMEGRDLVRSSPLSSFLAGRHAPDEQHEDGHSDGHGGSGHGHPSLLEPRLPEDGNAWGMTIDLNTCTGCNVCVVACQAENNIPVVGKEEVIRGREMHWIRVDRYFGGDLDHPSVLHQPVPCMHCENAPCEVVCPVGATTHSPDGLNEMTYNRCVGTRYCANNCPYKVRRFNFFKYADDESESLKLARNPEVTVRVRGVMEKCTYCVQRISRARIEAKRDGRDIADGEVVTACQSVCPAQAITFGDIHDPKSRVSEQKASPRNYGLLEELNTVPRTTYLAAVTNPNPQLVSMPAESERGTPEVQQHGDHAEDDEA